MAIDSKLGILLMFACTAWSSYYHLSLFVLVTITLSKGQDLIATPPEDKSCNGEYCSWDDEARKKDELLIEWRKSDHLECDISALGLSPEKIDKIDAILNSSILKIEGFNDMANRTDFVVNPHLVYRYLNSVEFFDNYHGTRIENAILNTATWRDQFGISSIDTSVFTGLVQNGLGYTSDVFDKHGRAIIYLKIGRNVRLESSETYLSLLMYTVERADRMSVQGGSGQFVAIVDLSGFAWSTCPPISMIKDSVGLLKKHYPYRLGGVFIVNGGATFNFLWSVVKPIMPKRALKKTFVLNKKEEYTVLDDKIGSRYFEDAYGGERKESIVAEEYFKQGFWYKKDQKDQKDSKDSEGQIDNGDIEYIDKTEKRENVPQIPA